MSVSLRNFALTVFTALVVTGLSQVVYNKFLRRRAAPALTAGEARSLITQILENLEPCRASCKELIEKVKLELQSSWGPATPSEAEMLRVYVYPTFKAAYLKVQDRACAEYNVHEWELEEAIQYYVNEQQDQQLGQLTQELADIIKSFGGGDESGGEGAGGASGGEEGGMTIASAVKAMSGRVVSATNELCTKYIAMHGVPESQEELMKFQSIYVQVAEDVQKAFLKELGTTPENWQQMIQQSIAKPEVQQALQDMNAGVEAVLKSHGIMPSAEGSDDMETTQIVMVLNELANRISSSTNDYCTEFVAKHGKPSTPELSGQFLMGLERIGEDTQNDYVAELGLTAEMWKQMLFKNASNPAVQASFQLITSSVTDVLARQGLQMNN